MVDTRVGQPAAVLCVGNPVVNRLFLSGWDEDSQDGLATIVDEEAMAAIVSDRQPIHTGPGGSLFTTALALARASTNVTFVGALGADDDADYLHDVSASCGLRFQAQEIDQTASAQCAVLISPNGERSLFTNPGAAAKLAAAHMPTSADELVMLEGYALQGQQGAQILEWFKNLPTQWKLLTLSASEVARQFSQQIVDARSAERFTLAGTITEAELLLPGVHSPCSAADSVVELGSVFPACEFILTDGSHAAWHLRDGVATKSEPPMVLRPTDQTGAGDHFLAGWAEATLAGRSVPSALAQGHEWAQGAIQRLGAIGVPIPSTGRESLRADPYRDSSKGKDGT